jgi:hypothetical protein
MKLRVATLGIAICVLTACASTPRHQSSSDLSGRWQLTTTSKVGSQDVDLVVHQSGQALTGTVMSPTGAVPYSGRVDGSEVTFQFTLRAAGRDLKISYSGQVNGDTMQGSTSFDAFGEGTFVAHRK